MRVPSQNERFMFEMEQTLNPMEFLEACPETFRLAKMNLAVRGISHNLGPKNQSTFEQDFHRGTKMDYIIANPPFNLKRNLPRAHCQELLPVPHSARTRHAVFHPMTLCRRRFQIFSEDVIGHLFRRHSFTARAAARPAASPIWLQLTITRSAP